ncbi:MAG TPA: sulfotransferase [Caulobacteraceae bacterium]
MPLSIVGAGLGRTGTMSLKLAIEQLGLGRCYHMFEVFQKPEAPAQWEAVADGHGPPWEEIFEGFTATVDWPSATYYRELAEAYPKAKVILTRRDPQAWYASTQATIFARDFTMPTNLFERMVMKTVGAMFDLEMHDRDWVISVYERHNAEVRRLIAAERLLDFEVAEGWGPLCAFLGVPVPDFPMPKVNSTEEFRARLASRT